MNTINYYRKNKNTKEILEMLQHSNWIEQELSSQAMDDAIDAWEYAIKNSDNITSRYVLKIHELMQKNIRPDIAGKFRQCDVYIGGECRKYIGDDLILAGIKEVIGIILDSKLNKKNQELDLDLLARDTHVKFEEIHPFEDGNGRVGRILYNIHRLKLKLPLHIIHEGDEQMEYYKWFRY